MNIKLFGIMMVAGGIFGVLFFLLFGYLMDAYEMITFIISMSGGIIFGCIMYIVTDYSERKDPQEKFYRKSVTKRLEGFEPRIKYDIRHKFEGLVNMGTARRVRLTQGNLYLLDDYLLMTIYDRGTIKIIESKYSNVADIEKYENLVLFTLSEPEAKIGFSLRAEQDVTNLIFLFNELKSK